MFLGFEWFKVMLQLLQEHPCPVLRAAWAREFQQHSCG